MDIIKRLLSSRKFVVALSGALAVVLNEVFGSPISEAQILSVLGTFALVIFGVAWEDSAEKGKISKEETQ